LPLRNSPEDFPVFFRREPARWDGALQGAHVALVDVAAAAVLSKHVGPLTAPALRPIRAAGCNTSGASSGISSPSFIPGFQEFIKFMKFAVKGGRVMNPSPKEYYLR
jgi:hypothetical protein